MSTDVEPLVPEGVRLTATGLTITNPNMPLEEAETIGHVLGNMHKSIQFAIGDWLIFIEAVYPDEWSQISEALGVSEEKRREYRRVAAAVPKSIRRKHVDWSHHRAVAPLEPAKQREWLKKVEVERMSHHALRDALRPHSNGVVATRECKCCGRPYDER